MPIDWDAIDVEMKQARKKTDDELAGAVSSLTRLTDEEVKELFPRQGDVQRLKQLMEIVRGSASEQKRINLLVANIEELGGTVLKLLGKLA